MQLLVKKVGFSEGNWVKQCRFKREEKIDQLFLTSITQHQSMRINIVSVTVAAPVLSQCCVRESRGLLALCLCLFSLNGGGNLPPTARQETEK